MSERPPLKWPDYLGITVLGLIIIAIIWALA